MKTPLAAIAAVSLAAIPAHAEISSWIHFGPEIAGEATDPAHAGWTEVLAFSTAQDPAPGVQSLVCQLNLDKASPQLMLYCANGKILPEVKLDVTKPTADGMTSYWSITFKDLLISSFSSASPEEGGPAPTTEITLQWSSLNVVYWVFRGEKPFYATTTLVGPDRDGDGMPDEYERLVGLDPSKSNLDLDSDNDGLSDLEEYRLGTHPKDPTSFFKATATPSAQPNGPLIIRWPSVAGEDYHITYSPDLVTPFQTIATITATSDEMTYAAERILNAGFFQVTRSLP